MKNILITGISGQDGLFLSSLITNEDVVIYGISRKNNHKNFYNNLAKVKNNIDMSKIKLFDINLLNYSDIENIITDILPYQIYNLSGPSSVYDSYSDNGKTEYEIKLIFENLTSSCIKNDIFPSFFQASSSEMYADNISKSLDEHSEFSPKSPYARAKYYNHKKSLEFYENYNWKIVSGIMFNHESEFRKDNYLFKKIINGAKNIKEKKSEFIEIGSLEYIRDWCFAGDVAHAIYLILNKGKKSSYVIGSGVPNKIGDLVNEVFSYYDLDISENIKINKSLLRDGDPEVIVANPTRLRKELGWEPSVSFKDLVRRCIEKN
jgi:GDPmannose 4,6-dehydratase